MPKDLDEVENVVDEVDEVIDETLPPKTREKTNDDKVFTQDEVNRIAARERKTAEKERDALKAQLDELDAEFSDELLELSKGATEFVKALPEGLTSREKVKLLKAFHGNKVPSMELKETPNGNNKLDDNPFQRKSIL